MAERGDLRGLPPQLSGIERNGVGDLHGITARLPYLQRLGVDAIWVAPIYPSPQVDFGYDTSDYRAVYRQYGALADLDRLIVKGRKHRIRVILDLVLNHTSDQHAWFRESAGSRTGPKANWYVWSDGIAADAPGVGAFRTGAILRSSGRCST